MNEPTLVNAGRRGFLKASAAASLYGGTGLVLGFWLPDLRAQAPAPAVPTTPNAFVVIGSDDTVTVIAKHLEMGQGSYTGLATIVAEELDASWAQIRIVGAPADARLYNNLSWGPAQGTGGSSSIANSWDQLRNAGAAARAMLVAAAAKQWNVAPETIAVRNGVVTSGTKKATFGELAVAAGSMPVPQSPRLKDPKDYVYVGKTFPRKDSRAKSNGTATFTCDVSLPGMLTAVVAHPPRFGAKVKRFDAAAAAGIDGVRYVVEVPGGIAVVANGFWPAKKGRDALQIEWDESSAFRSSSSEIMAEYRRLAAGPGTPARNDGDAAKAMAAAAKTLEAAYEFPFLAHAAMEPMDCVIRLGRERCEVWNGEQMQTGDQHAVARTVGVKPEQVTLNMLFAGGSFGRRASTTSDYLVEAAAIVKALAAQGNYDLPVKLIWTREDDMKAGYYRPAYFHALKAGLDERGNVVAWQHRIVGQSILTGSPFAAMIKDGVDVTSVEGASTLPYAIPNLSVDLHSPAIGVPVLWWRSVGSTHTAYSTETFIDELARAAGKDPVDFRRALLAGHPRHLGVLDLAAREGNWRAPLARGKVGEKRGRGIAVHESFHSYVAQVAEVTVKPDNTFRVDRVVCAVDCGIAVNPDNVRAQMEGGIGFGLSAALHGAITFKDGVVEQSNFHDYPVLRIDEMPRVEVHIVASGARPTGVGEPGVPPIAPAIANAIAAATGRRLRELPLKIA